MIEHEVRSFPELHEVFRRYENDRLWMFRGHSNIAWRLIPKAGRSEFFLRNEQVFFEAWKRRAIEYMRSTLPNDWEWLAVAQHHGFSTRLLDWSANPLVACFFAVAGDNEPIDHAVLYAFRPEFRAGTELSGSPFAIENGVVCEYRPSAFAARISRQDARFTVHCPPNADILSSEHYGRLEKIMVRSNYVARLRIELDQYGYNYGTIFPDLDGISRHLNWIASQRDIRRNLIPEEERSGGVQVSYGSDTDNYPEVGSQGCSVLGMGR